ncbi:ABC transporter permease [Thiocapsa sp.]|uniref:ABC transporter permease n=1 Tax=Thiocapsa sp. TaxID=2024551 RepID=UPI0025E2C868|nr:ABC transporter permease [Thiocapsa sp.]
MSERPTASGVDLAQLRSTLPTVAAGLAVAAFFGIWILAPTLVIALALVFVGWLALTRTGRQALAVARVGLSTVPERLGATSVVVVGIAGVVGVLVALQAMAAGFEATLTGAGSDDTALVLRAAANAELSSALDRPSATLIIQAPGIKRDANDRPVASVEVVVVASVPKRTTGTDANLEVRGVGPAAWQIRPQVRVVQGRRFRPGLRELIVGQGALQQFSGLEIGDSIVLNNQDWRIVGVFASGDTHESEVWGDAESIAAAYRRNGFQSVAVRLTEPAAIERLRTALSADPRLRVDVESTRAYYGKQSERLTRVIRAVGIGVAVMMALGAVFGALNTMYAAVASRAREIATLRALGFTGLPVVVAIMLETMALACAGGILGAGIAWALFHGFTVSTLGSNFSQVVFQFQVTPELLIRGLQWALGIGFIGGIFPALRAARLPVTTALRES